MKEVYRTEFVPRRQAEALVVHCSDPNYQPHFQEFLHRHLGLDSYELIAVPGGPQFLTLVEYLPKFGWTGWRWVKFLVDVAKPSRVILINHENCRWYRDPRFWTDKGDLRPRQVEDLAGLRKEFRERFPELEVVNYYARHQFEHVVFEQV